MTHYFGIRDLGRAGGSWLMYICNTHPAGMRVAGELHLSLGFAWPCPVDEYDVKVTEFLKSQAAQKIAVAGIVKCFWAKTENLIRSRGGTIVQVIRNPMELVGFRMLGKVYQKINVARRFLGHEARDKTELFLAHALYYKHAYEYSFSKWRQEPVIRLEDLNRSCGSDGLAFKNIMEYITQTEFPMGYVRHVQEYCLPGYHYGHCLIQQDGIVVDIEHRTYTYELWRMSWADDAQPGFYWESWSSEERKIFTKVLGPICNKLGYDYQGRPGFTNIRWSLDHHYPWSEAAGNLEPIPATLPGLAIRRNTPWEIILPVFKGE